MGMAASQARFLNLTARKTNIEYQGQQINQQRTELSNKSATLYNQMLTLQVPSPPNSQDYTKVSYTFMMPGGIDEATVSQFTPTGTAGEYSVSFSYKTSELGLPACSDSEKSKATKLTTTTTINSKNVSNYTITTSSGKGYDLKVYNGDEPPATIPSTATDAEKERWAQYELFHDVAKELIGYDDMDYYDPTATDDKKELLYYVNVGTEAAPKYQYYKGSELASATADGATTNAVSYYSPGEIVTYVEDSYTPCTINRDVYNRVQSFTHTPSGGSSTTFSVTTKTITDDEAYNDAMNEYTYKSYLYEQEMANINAQTSIIQAQDKELELKLKQLDTEHNAVQTEIEAVQGVCKKNVEDSFKIFA